MFEHLKDQEGLPWPRRIGYFLAACAVVLSVFAVSLWLIAKTVNFFSADPGVPPVAVHYDADEDGAILNEILEEHDEVRTDPAGLATEPQQP